MRLGGQILLRDGKSRKVTLFFLLALKCVGLHLEDHCLLLLVLGLVVIGLDHVFGNLDIEGIKFLVAG